MLCLAWLVALAALWGLWRYRAEARALREAWRALGARNFEVKVQGVGAVQFAPSPAPAGWDDLENVR